MGAAGGDGGACGGGPKAFAGGGKGPATAADANIIVGAAGADGGAGGGGPKALAGGGKGDAIAECGYGKTGRADVAESSCDPDRASPPLPPGPR